MSPTVPVMSFIEKQYPSPLLHSVVLFLVLQSKQVFHDIDIGDNAGSYLESGPLESERHFLMVGLRVHTPSDNTRKITSHSSISRVTVSWSGRTKLDHKYSR